MKAGRAPTDSFRKGSRSELYAAYIFVGLGFDVFWPVIQNSPVDFILHTAEGYLRVQVKTAYADRGNVRVNTRNNGYAKGAFDSLVAVHGTRIWWMPWPEVSKYRVINLSKRAPLHP